MPALHHIPAAIAYHSRNARKPLQILRALRQQGHHPSPALIRDAVAYSHEVLGSHRFIPWLITQSTFRGRLHEGWITDNFMGEVVARRLNRPFGTSAAKTFTAKVLSAELLPDLGYLIDGLYYDRNFRPLTRSTFQQLLFNEGAQVVMKLDGGGSGRDVTLIGSSDLDRVALIAGRRRAVFQHLVTQHACFDDFCSGGATLRLMTVREPDGAITLRSCYLRFPAAAESVVGRGEVFHVFLDPGDGRPLSPMLTNLWQQCESLPERGARIADCRLPDYAAARRIVMHQHAQLPHFACIGWDVMIDRDARHWIIEWNTDYPAVSMAEAVTGPNFRGLRWEELLKR